MKCLDMYIHVYIHCFWLVDSVTFPTHLRELRNIRGFSRETLNAIIANIESREWRRQYCNNNDIRPEHPRSSTTDDIECFFSVLRDSVGKRFHTKRGKV